MEILRQFLEFLSPYGVASYWVMYGVLIACGFGFPMPEDIILVSGGILAAQGITDLWMTNVVCMLGVLMGDGTIYFVGRKFGPSVKKTWLFRRVLNEKTNAKVEGFFSRYGDKVVFMGRFMPGLRMPIFMSAGIYGVSPGKFFGLDGFAALISVPLWIWVGYAFGKNMDVLEQKISQFQYGLYAVLAVVIVTTIAVVIAKKKFINKQIA